jgi:uncharacterized protein YceK
MTFHCPLLLAILSALLLCSGCTSVFTHTTTRKEVGAYPGVRADAHLLAHPRSIRKPPIHPAVAVTYSLLDFPFSAVFDTLVLPIDLTYRESSDPMHPSATRKTP